MKKIATLEEEIRILKTNLQVVIAENANLQLLLEDQKQITLANKKLISHHHK